MSNPPPNRVPGVERFASNPILHAADWPYPVNAVFNPGAVALDDGSTLLLCRVEDHSGLSHLTTARSTDGLTNWSIDPRPTLAGDGSPEEQWGVEDPRITPIADGRFALCYTSYGIAGPCVSLALTTDFRSFDRMGIALPPNNKDAAIFPELIAGRYAMLHRPTCPDAGSGIWIAYSDDLRHWGAHRLVMSACGAGWWDSAKIGLAAPPIPVEDAWLILYHGVRNTASGAIYRVGAALLDRQRPERVIARPPRWFMGPSPPDERTGDVNNVVFPCGAIIRGQDLWMYYGMADTAVGAARVNLRELVAWARLHPSDA